MYCSNPCYMYMSTLLPIVPSACATRADASPTPHRASPESAIALVGLDYYVVTKDCVTLRAELNHATGAPRSMKTKTIFSHVAPYKEAGEENFVCGFVLQPISHGSATVSSY